jgi:Family of unknown function (DUF5681)
MRDEPKEGIGRGRPPVATRFKPGQSGNPAGRPKRPPSFVAELMGELAAEIAVEGGREKITRQRAIVRSLVNAAIDGNVRVLSLLVPVLARLTDKDGDSLPGDPADREILDEYISRELRRRAQDATTKG